MTLLLKDGAVVPDTNKFYIIGDYKTVPAVVVSLICPHAHNELNVELT